MIISNKPGLTYKKGDKLKGEPNSFVIENQDCDDVDSKAIYENKKAWDNILQKYPDNLVLVWQIKKSGLPIDVNQRIEVLKRLASREKGQYRVTYDDLCEYSKQFEEEYPVKLVEDLTREIQNGGDFQMAIDNSNLTSERKWLLRFVFQR